MSARHALEHELWRSLKSEGLVGRPVLLSVSGGADSMALATAWGALRPAAEIEWLHVHHGAGANALFRDEAEAYVRQEARRRGVRLTVHRASPRSSSEAALRDARRDVWRAALSARDPRTLVVTAHHASDLLETRLIRLLRGTGAAGFVSFGPRRGRLFRPFLRSNPAQLRRYLQEVGVSWVEDPSNASSDPLRNWVRGVWLPQLEAKRPGAIAAFARSLDLLAEALVVETDIPRQSVVTWARPEYAAGSEPQRRRRVVQAYRALGARPASRAQIDEVKRHLDSSRKGHTFIVGEVLWTVNAQQILAVRRSGDLRL